MNLSARLKNIMMISDNEVNSDDKDYADNLLITIGPTFYNSPLYHSLPGFMNNSKT